MAGGDDRVLERGRGRVHPHGGEASASVGRPRHLGWHHGHVRRALSGGGLESHGPQAGALLGSAAAKQERLRVGRWNGAGWPNCAGRRGSYRGLLSAQGKEALGSGCLLAHRGLDEDNFFGCLSCRCGFLVMLPAEVEERGGAGRGAS